MAPFRFGTPAFIQDFPEGSPEAEQLAELWSTRVHGFTEQAITGNPWNTQYSSDQTWYFDPTTTPIPQGTAAAPVQWSAFPNRLNQYLGVSPQLPQNPYDLGEEAIFQIADSGKGFEQIPTVLCPQADWNGALRDYGPYGPRGWLDEYCEWSVTRDGQQNVVRIDFVCENPEYWYTLWSVSPERAAQIYQATLNAGAPSEHQVEVSVEDLTLKDPTTGETVIDPSTGGPAYNPLNKWNSGPVSFRGTGEDRGGAMHLTSTPNTLQTEMGLAGAATVQRQIGNSDAQKLICCAQYGQNYRNSDPHIGQSVNQVVSAGNRVSLADPVGLYIQSPDTSLWGLPDDPKLPPDADPAECWQVLRGASTLTDPVTGEYFPGGDPGGGFILHAAFQIPQRWIDAGVTAPVGDVTIAGDPVQYAGQVAQTFQIGLYGRPLEEAPPAAQPCVASTDEGEIQPLQLFHASLWDAYYGTSVPNPVGYPMSLASNTVIVPPRVEAGASGLRMALTCSGVVAGPDGEPPAIAFPGAGATATNVSGAEDVEYAVPGNSYPGGAQLVTFELAVDAATQPGLYPIAVTNFSGAKGEPAPAFLQVVPAGSIAG